MPAAFLALVAGHRDREVDLAIRLQEGVAVRRPRFSAPLVLVYLVGVRQSNLLRFCPCPQRVPGATQGAAPDARGDAALLARAHGPDAGRAARQGGPEVVRQREALLLPAALPVPHGLGLAAAAGGAVAPGRVRAGRPAVRLHGHRRHGPGHAAARPGWQGERCPSTLSTRSGITHVFTYAFSPSNTARPRRCSSQTRTSGSTLCSPSRCSSATATTSASSTPSG